MKHHLVTFDHITVGFTNQKDAMAFVGLLGKAVKMRQDFSQGYDREIWIRELVGELRIRTMDLKDVPPDKPALRPARGRALPAPAPALQLGYSNSDPYAE